MAYRKSSPSSDLVQIVENPKSLTSFDLSPFDPSPPKQLKGFSLRVKVILMAIALSVIPVTLISAIAYKVTESHITRQISQAQFNRSGHLAHTLSQYISSRANEAQTLAGSPIFTNPNVMNTVTLSQKKAALDTFQEQTGFYDSIVYLDLKGNPLFQSKSERPLTQNYGDRQYFQKAIAIEHTTMNTVDISDITGEARIEFAVPVQNSWTGEVIGVIRFRIPSEQIIPLFTDFTTEGEQWHFINTKGIFFASASENLNNRPLVKYYPQLQESHLRKQMATFVANSPLDPTKEQLVSYAPVKIGAINPLLNLGTAISLDKNVAFAPLNSLRWIFLGGTVGTVILVGLVAGFLANRIIQPLLKLTSAVGQLSQGKLDTRIKLKRQDELALLGNQINDMAQQLDISMQRQKTIARTFELIARMSQAQTIEELQLPLSSFLSEVRRSIEADRVVFYQFDEQWQGIVVAESVDPSYPRTLGVRFKDPCFAKDYVQKYQRGRIKAVTNIYRANLTTCHLQQLEPYHVKASLVVPVILDSKTNPKSEKLIGLLIAHQCSEPRVWEQSYIEYFQQIAHQLAIVLTGYIFYKEENFQKAGIQKDIVRVLNRMEKIADGDLTASSSTKLNHTNTIAQSFDNIIGNMRQTIAQIKLPSQQINQELVKSKSDLYDLKEQLNQQANQLVLIFASMDRIASSVGDVSSQVKLTSKTVDSIVSEIEVEKTNFSQAISFMSELENTLRNNTHKIKNLSNASKKMTRVIDSIRKINLRASLLTSKLGQRISLMDNSPFGLKGEIESIQQSIVATKKLETVIRDIDDEISRVIRDYEASEAQLEQEHYLKLDSRSNLGQIYLKTESAQQQLFSLIEMTDRQIQGTQQISELQNELENMSESISISSDRIIDSWEKTTLTAKDLENASNFFNLEQTVRKNSATNS